MCKRKYMLECGSSTQKNQPSFFMSQNTQKYMAEMLSVLCRAAVEGTLLGPWQWSLKDKHQKGQV